MFRGNIRRAFDPIGIFAMVGAPNVRIFFGALAVVHCHMRAHPVIRVRVFGLGTATIVEARASRYADDSCN